MINVTTPSDAPATQVTTPATQYAEITPADTDLVNPCRAVYIGVTGNLTVQLLDDSVVEFVAVPAGSLLPIVAKQIRAATSATSIVAIF